MPPFLGPPISLATTVTNPDRYSDRASGLTQVIMAFVYSLLLLAYIQFAGPEIVGSDGYYHIKVADLMRQHGVPLDFPWLQFTILDRDGYTDHHLLLHAFQGVFTALFDDLRLAAKWSAVLAAAATFAAIAWVLWRLGVRAPLFWLLILFAASSPFLYRMSMARGQSLSLAIQVLAFYLMMQRKYLALAIISAVYVWAYNGFAVMLPLAAIGMAVHFVVDRRFEYRIGIAVCAGIAVGLLTHPYFPRDVLFLWNHIVPKLFTTEYGTSVGREWYPYSSWSFLTLSLGAVTAFGLAVFLLDWRQLLKDRPTLFWFLTTTMYCLLFLKSRRFAEYFPPSAVILLALTTRHWQFWTNPGAVLRSPPMIALTAAAAIFIGACFVWTLNDVRDDIRGQAPVQAYQGGARWLAANTPPRELVFHTDWDDFPKLFYFNTHNTYVIGLDPDFMRLKHPELFSAWRDATRGKSKDPGRVIERFGARYVFTDTKHKKFIRSVAKDPRFTQVYSDQWSKVYRFDGKAPKDG